MVDLVQIRKLAERKEDENFSFRRFLKTRCNLEPNEIDQRVFETTRRVWAGIDCTTCANCCREMKSTFSEEEVERVARRLSMGRQQFIETYLECSEAGSENPWRTRVTPCPFLKGNLCSIYEDRPTECSGYPYLYDRNFVFRTLGMAKLFITERGDLCHGMQCGERGNYSWTGNLEYSIPCSPDARLQGASPEGAGDIAQGFRYFIFYFPTVDIVAV